MAFDSVHILLGLFVLTLIYRSYVLERRIIDKERLCSTIIQRFYSHFLSIYLDDVAYDKMCKVLEREYYLFKRR